MRVLPLAVICLLATSTASAAEFVVTKTQDTNDGACTASNCSLRDAVIAANAAAGDDTVTLPAGLYVLTHTGAGEDAAVTGDLDITDNLTINGDAAETTIIHGGGGGLLGSPDRIFDVSGTASFALHKITLRNGEPPDNGAGIRMIGTGTLRIDSCVFLENHTAPSSGGGAIYADATGATTPPAYSILNSTFRQNSADRGGGAILATDVNLTIDTTEISENSAGSGGAVAYFADNGGTLNVTRGTLSNNTAGTGGAIDTLGSDLTVSDSTITDNTATTAGAISCVTPSGDTSTMTITNTVISDNQAEGGGGIFKQGGTLTLTGVTMENNEASVDIIGAVGFGGTQLTVNGNSVIRGNSAETDGAGLYVKPSVGPTTVLIEDSLIEQNSSNTGNGGGVYVQDADLSLHTATLKNNFAHLGGGVLLTGTSGASIQDSTFDGNLSSFEGGAIFDNATSDLSVSGSTFSGNSATLVGGGLAFASSNKLTVVNSTFADNQAKALVNDGVATVTNSTFFGNEAVTPGAAINNTGTLTLSNSALVSATGNNCQGALITGGHNLDADGSCGLGLPGDQIVDPQLGPLADNGGPTQTCAPLSGSPAIDAGNDTLCPTTDQRGITRPLDGNVDGAAHCDIGAVELTACGDGVVQSPEECDDGNTADGDACNADCTLPNSGGGSGTGGTTGGTSGTSSGATGSVESASSGCSLIR